MVYRSRFNGNRVDYVDTGPDEQHGRVNRAGHWVWADNRSVCNDKAKQYNKVQKIV